VYDVPIQREFVAGVDETTGALIMRVGTVLDLKAKLEEVSGIDAGSQVLYPCSSSTTTTTSGSSTCHGSSNSGDCMDVDAEQGLEDVQTVDACGIREGGVQRLSLVVDAGRHYWQQHARLVRRYKARVVKVYRVMSACANELRNDNNGNTPDGARRRFTKFLRNCRKALAVLLERPVTHQPRPLDDIRRLERHFDDIVMPIFDAVAKREAGGRMERVEVGVGANANEAEAGNHRNLRLVQ
jgi:hypothetical protein